MIKRYNTDDIPKVKDFFREDKDKYIILSTCLLSADMLYFDIWLSSDENGYTAVIFRSYGNFYVKLADGANHEEVATFLGFMSMLTSLCGSKRDMEKLLPLFRGEFLQEHVKVARHTDISKLDAYDLEYKTTQNLAQYRSIYQLLRDSSDVRMIPFDDFYFIRKGLQKNKTGRTYYLEVGGTVFTTVSTGGEVEGLALIENVATNAEYRRKGLATAIVSKMCLDLLGDNITPFVTYSTEEAGELYKKLGFEVVGENIVIRLLNDADTDE